MSAKPQVLPVTTQLWSCVGSAGTVNLDDTAKVEFAGSIVKLRGIDQVVVAQEPTPSQSAPKKQVIKTTTTQAVVRYSIAPVDALLALSNLGTVGLMVYCKRGNGNIQAKLIQVPISPGPNNQIAETAILICTSKNPNTSQFNDEFADGGTQVNFNTNSYYVELTLSETSPVAITLPRNPPEVAAIQLLPRL